MIHQNKQTVPRKLGEMASACSTAIKSVRADKHMRESERNEIAECLRQAAENLWDCAPHQRAIEEFLRKREEKP